jgi:4-amino-4-deoxy-L-arabinose transferase-like glycosyltransferase
VPSGYKSTRELLIKKILFKRQMRSMGKNSRGEAAAVAESARHREKAREEARWPAGARVFSKVKMSWHRMVLIAVLALSAFLNLYRLTSEGYGNLYYAATVKDMLASWHNFFFASYDAGFVSVDKPPLGFWIQATSAYLFGFHGWSLLLPQALAGVLCVALLYHLVDRSFGPVAGLLAALALALTPISVATDRSNNLESLLALAVLLAAWAFILAAETGRLRWLVVGGLVMGLLGFNIKMLEAFVVLPAFYLLYLVAAPVGWRRRVIHLGFATIVIVAASLPWVVAVDLTPAEQRPYVGSSSFNTVTDLIVGWDGVERLVGSDKDVGDPGPLRLLNRQLSGQIGWLLLLAIVGLAVASWQRRPSLRLLNSQQQALVLWGTWFMTLVVFFSVAGDWDPYYLAMLAPAVAALVGAGVMALWDDYRSPGWRGWLLPLTLVGTAGLQSYSLALFYSDWSHWLAPTIVILCLAAAASLVAARPEPGLKVSGYLLAAISIGVLSVFLAPATWAASTVWYGAETRAPTAGPQAKPSETSSRFPGDGEKVAPLVDYLEANQDDATYLVAAIRSYLASPIILNTDEPVIAFGGFEGRDPAFSIKRLADLVNLGSVRFFVIGKGDIERAAKLDTAGRRPKVGEHQVRLKQLPHLKARLKALEDLHEKKEVRWITDNCEQVPQRLWQSSTSSSPNATVLLYDCGTQD